MNELRSPITEAQVARFLRFEDPLAYRKLEIQVLEHKLLMLRATVDYHQVYLDQQRAELEDKSEVALLYSGN